MINERDAILDLVRRRADGRPVRWVDKKTSAGDFEGRDWTIEVFDVAKGDRLALREKLWDLFNAVRKHTGKPMSLVTHTPEDTNSFYAWVRSAPNRDTALPGVPRGTPPRAIGRDLRTTPRTSAEAVSGELEGLVRGLLTVAAAAPSPAPLETHPITILVSAQPEGWRYALDQESTRRLRVVNGPEWRQASVSVAEDVASDFAKVAAPNFGELNHSLVLTLTGLDVRRLHATFGGVRFVAQPGGKTIWEWPAPDVRPGYCLSCHQHGTLRDAGPGTFVCAYCGNVQPTDGLWVAALS